MHKHNSYMTSDECNIENVFVLSFYNCIYITIYIVK